MFKVRADVGTDNVPVLYITDSIGGTPDGRGITTAAVQKFLEANRKAPTVDIVISSTGGDATTGFAIFTTLMEFPGKVTTKVLDLAASAAAIIFLAGSRRIISDTAQVMIHECSIEAAGGKNVIRNALDVVNMTNASMLKIICRRTGQPENVVKAWMQQEKWFDARSAKSLGFATEISSEPTAKAQASFDLSRFKHPPASLVSRQAMPLATVMHQTTSKANEAKARKRLADALTPAQRVAALGKPKSMADLIRFTKGEHVSI